MPRHGARCISQDKTGTFYIRRIIPKKLRKHFEGRSQFVKSLKTKSQRLAVQRSRPYNAYFDSIFYDLAQRGQLADLSRRVNHSTETETVKKKDEPRWSLEEEAEEMTFQVIDGRPYWTNFGGELKISSVEITPAASADGVRLTKLITLYIEDKVTTKAWSVHSVKSYETHLKRLVEIIGDRNISEYTAEDVQRYRQTLQNMPKDINRPPYNEMPLKQALKASKSVKLASSTVNKRLIDVASLFKWAVDHHIGGLTYNIFKKSVVIDKSKAKRVRADKQRRALTEAEMTTLFENLWTDKKPFQYWVVPIAAFTGMRLGEICQLDRKDIREIGGVWCIDINDDGKDKTLKTSNAMRIVPIHSKLLEFGFVKYAKSRSGGKLFPELKPTNGKWGHAVSKWFGYYRKKLRIEDGATFHGIRHLVATKLRDAGIAETFAAELTGHETGHAMTYTRYAKKGPSEKLREAVESLEYVGWKMVPTKSGRRSR